jgi:hypothetical protein
MSIILKKSDYSLRKRIISSEFHTVIASEAKQSSFKAKRVDGLLRFARNDGVY